MVWYIILVAFHTFHLSSYHLIWHTQNSEPVPILHLTFTQTLFSINIKKDFLMVDERAILYLDQNFQIKQNPIILQCQEPGYQLYYQSSLNNPLRFPSGLKKPDG